MNTFWYSIGFSCLNSSDVTNIADNINQNDSYLSLEGEEGNVLTFRTPGNVLITNLNDLKFP